MANQNKSTYQANVDSLITTNGVGDISGADVNTILKNLSDSVLHKSSAITSLGTNGAGWDLQSYAYIHSTSVYSANTTLTLSNTVDGGRYMLSVNKSGAGDVELTIACNECATIKHQDNGSLLTLSGASSQFYLIEFQRQGGVLYTYDLLNVGSTGGGLANVVEDLTPQLGGDLDLNVKNIVSDITTGTKIGTATTQKLAFYNSTPIVQPANTLTARAALENLGLLATGAGDVSTQELWIPAGAYTSATTNGASIASRETTTNKNNYTYAAFDTTTSEIVWFTWTPPANWDAGTVRFKLYWTNTAGLTTETIDFDLAAVSFADSDALDTAVGTAQNVTDTWLAQNDMHITGFSSAITIAGTPAAGEEVHFKLSRDVAADNMTGDVDVIGINLEYSITSNSTT
jgi:hypothetical protein